jgi:hypothetical protein
MRRIGYGLVDHDVARLVPQPADVDANGPRGQERQQLVGPLDHRHAVAVQHLLDAQIDELDEAPGAVRIEVIDRVPAAVLVDQHEGRARHVRGHTEAAGEPLQEAGLARAELAGARHDRPRRETRPEALADGLRLFRAVRDQPAISSSAAGSCSTMSPAIIATSPRSRAARSPARPCT